MILIIDNYDSFTYNLYQAFAAEYHDVKVVLNNQITLEEIENLNLKGIVISPGPGRPESAGISVQAIRYFGSRKPILGVCLGHQAIGLTFGAKINRCADIMHGKESLVFHQQEHLFEGMPLPFNAGRYHSLMVENLPSELIVDAVTSNGVIMGMHHIKYPIYGVQFHPESILTQEGTKIVKNFLEKCS